MNRATCPLLYLLLFSGLALGGQEYTIITCKMEEFHPGFFRITEDGISRTPHCRCDSTDFRAGKRDGFHIRVEHWSSSAHQLVFYLDVPEPVRIHRFEVNSSWSNFRHLGMHSSLPVQVDAQRTFRLTPTNSWDFTAGNSFNVQIEVSLLSEAPERRHLIELSGVLEERNGSKPFKTIELKPEKTDRQVAPEEFSRAIRGGPCSGVLFYVASRVLDRETLILRLEVGPPIEIRGIKVLGPYSNPDGFRSLVSVFGTRVEEALPAKTDRLNDVYYRLNPEHRMQSSGSLENLEIEFEIEIGGCPSTHGEVNEGTETLRYRARPMK